MNPRFGAAEEAIQRTAGESGGRQTVGTINLNEAATAAIANLVASGVIEKAVEAAITKTVKDSVESALSRYGDFGKQLDKAVANSLAIHGDIDLPSYNHTVLKIMERQVESLTVAAIERQVADRMKQLLTPAPETIKLSELVKQYVKDLKERHDGESGYGVEARAFAELKVEDSFFKKLTLAPSAKTDRYGGRRDGEICISLTKEGKCYHLSFRDESMEKKLFAGPFFDFERQIFQMRAAGTVIEIDCDPSDCELNYGYVD